MTPRDMLITSTVGLEKDWTCGRSFKQMLCFYMDQILKEDDANWLPPDMVGRQELEIILGEAHISFTTTKLGSLMQVQQSQDPEGLRTFYYLVQVWALDLSVAGPRLQGL